MLIVIICFLIIIIFIFVFNKFSIENLVSIKNNSSNLLEYNFKEADNIDPGPIKFYFYLTPFNVKSTKLYKCNIDNNGKGYLSLFDLFCNGNLGIKNINDKISNCIEQLNEKYNILNEKNINNYFSDSRYCKIQINSSECECNPVNCITISELTLFFDSGVSFVNSLNNGIGIDNLGDSWGNPIYFEIGGNKLSLPKYDLQDEILTQDLSNINKMNFGDWKPLEVSLLGKNYPIQFNNIKIVGNGQGLSTIRGSCIFIIYDINKSSTSLGDGWFSENAYKTFASRRLEIQGFLWTGHFGVCTDYSLYQSYKTTIKSNNIIIGSNPSYNEQKLYIPSYNQVSNNCIVNNILDQGSVEILLIDVWVELQQNTIQGAILPTFNLGYPLLLISNISMQRIYYSNVTVMSYQLMNDDCKGLVYINSGFLPINTQFPGDIFLQQCSFASRNTNVNKDAGITDSISLYINNSDKVSIVNSTFHGQFFCESNKLAMFNCYCLHVGNPNLQGYDTDFTLANPAVIYKQANNQNSSKTTGWGNLKTSSRVIFQNIIFIVHISGDSLLKSNPPINGKTLEDFYTNNYFNIGGGKINDVKYNYDYFQKKTLYPFYIDTTMNKNLYNITENLTNIFMQSCVYYAIIIGDNSIGDNNIESCPFNKLNYSDKIINQCPYKNLNNNNNNNNKFKENSFGKTTFSALNLTNIKNAFIDNFNIDQKLNGNKI